MSEAKAKEAAAARARAAASGADVSAWGTTFDVELSSPYFEAPKQVFLRDEEPDGGAADPLIMSPGQTTEGAFTASPVKSKSGAAGDDVTLLAGPSFEASLLTPRGGDPSGLLPLVLHPKAPGVYPCKIVLRAPKDIRVYHIEATVLEENIAKTLEFVAAARQAVTQDIPIVNNTEFEWSLTAKLTGSEFFKGQRLVTVPPRTVGMYSVVFKPDWVCDALGEVTLEHSPAKHGGTTPPPMVFTLKGIGLEPLSEEHVVITCAARDTVTRTFTVRNPGVCAHPLTLVC